MQSYPSTGATGPKICVFTRRNALNPAEHASRERVRVALEVLKHFAAVNPSVAFLGCNPRGTPGTPHTEAETMLAYFIQLFWAEGRHLHARLGCANDLTETVDTPDIDSCDATCAYIVRHWLAHGRVVYLVINKPHQRRVRFLMRRHVRLAGLEWRDVAHRVNFVPCGGTFVPYRQSRGLAYASAHWLWNSVVREAAAWVKVAFPRPATALKAQLLKGAHRLGFTLA